MSLATVQRLRTRLTVTMLVLLAVALGTASWLTARPSADEFLDTAPQDLLVNPTDYTVVAQVGEELPGFLVKFVGVGAIFAFFAGAYAYFLSGGSEDQINKGRMQMVGSVIALFVVIFAERIVNVFVTFFATGK